MQTGGVHNMALSWQQAAWLTAVLAVLAVALYRMSGTWPRRIAPFARETALIAFLYAVWQLAGTLSIGDGSGAFTRARWIESAERALHLPSEEHLQRVVTSSSALTQAANIYYATMHFAVLFAFLLWLFACHRERYPAVRNVLALTTLACLLIQLVPVAPPRLLPGSGLVDTAAEYGQSVYQLGFGADQLSAMPSVHVAWAVLVGWYTARIGRSAWRWLGTVHAVLTVVVVVATANHWWADGMVAVAVLCGCAWLHAGLARMWQRVLARHREAGPDSPESPGREPALTS